MGFTVKAADNEVVLELQSDGCGGVDLCVVDGPLLLSIDEDGTLFLHNGIKQDDVGNLKLTDMRKYDFCDTYIGRRVSVFYDGEELVPSGKIPTPKKSKKGK